MSSKIHLRPCSVSILECESIESDPLWSPWTTASDISTDGICSPFLSPCGASGPLVFFNGSFGSTSSLQNCNSSSPYIWRSPPKIPCCLDIPAAPQRRNSVDVGEILQKQTGQNLIGQFVEFGHQVTDSATRRQNLIRKSLLHFSPLADLNKAFLASQNSLHNLTDSTNAQTSFAYQSQSKVCESSDSDKEDEEFFDTKICL